jgi:hypothetical protein
MIDPKDSNAARSERLQAQGHKPPAKEPEASAPTPAAAPADKWVMPAALPAIAALISTALLFALMIVFTTFDNPFHYLLVAIAAGAPAGFLVIAVHPILDAQARRRQGPRYRKGQTLGWVLLDGGTLDHFAVKSGALQSRPTGDYVVQGTPYYVEKTVPRGTHIFLWPQGDPEPFTARMPLGFGSQWLANFVGGIRAAAKLNALRHGAGLQLSPFVRFLIFAAVAGTVLGGGYLLFDANGWI